MFAPPQIIISLPVQTAVCPARADGALIVLTGTHASVTGLYLDPVFSDLMLFEFMPPQTIISLPVQIALCAARPKGMLLVLEIPSYLGHNTV